MSGRSQDQIYNAPGPLVFSVFHVKIVNLQQFWRNSRFFGQNNKRVFNVFWARGIGPVCRELTLCFKCLWPLRLRPQS